MYNAIMWSYGYSLIESDKRDYLVFVEEQQLLDKGSNFTGSPPFSMWRNMWKNLFLPVPVACMAGVVAGLIPGIKEIFFDKESMVYVLTDAFLSMGYAGVIVGQISLGANLMLLSSQKNTLSLRYVASIVVFKNIVTPLAALGIIYGLWECGIFGEDLVMVYVVFISFCCPTALVIMIITQLADYATKEVAFVMFWIYCTSILTLIVSTYLFFIIFTIA